ncbi:MAG: hypothetical protein R3E91_04010 [Chlamydiales bacterium]
MCKKFLILLSFFIVLAIAFIDFFILKTTNKEQKIYLQLLAKSRSTPSLPRDFEQRGKGILKEIWYQNHSSFYIRIKSNLSKLLFSYQEDGLEITEQLDGVTCWIQEKSFDEEKGKFSQHVQRIEAKEAFFNYKKQILLCKEAEVWDYDLPGNRELLSLEKEMPLIVGSADTVEIGFKENLSFSAYSFKAKFN